MPINISIETDEIIEDMDSQEILDLLEVIFQKMSGTLSLREIIKIVISITEGL